MRRLKGLFKESLYQNSFFLMATGGLGGVLGFVFWIVAARFYTPSEVGIASALIAAMMLLGTFSRLGFDIGIIRFLSAEEDKRGMINSCLTIAGLASLILSLIFAAGLDFWSPALSFIRTDIPFLLSFIIFTVVLALLAMLNNVFVAFRRAEFSLFQVTTVGVLRISLPILAVSAGAFGLFFSWGIGICLAIAVSLLLFLPRLQSKYRPLLSIKKRIVKDIARYSFMNYLALMLANVPTYLLPLLIINTLGSETTAYFRTAWAISSILFLAVPTAINTSLFAEGSHKPEKLREHTIRAASLMLVLVITGIAFVYLLGDKMLLLFGAAYAENGLRVLQILALSSIPVVFIQLYLTVRVVQLRMKAVILAQALTSTVVLGMIYALMSRLGLIGVGIGWTVGQALAAVMIGAIILIRRRNWFKP